MSHLSRRAALRAAGVSGLGLAGGMATGGSAAAASVPPPAAASVPPPAAASVPPPAPASVPPPAAASVPPPAAASVTTRLVLHANGLRSSGVRKGRNAGDSYLITGGLSPERGGVTEGEFYASATVTARSNLLVSATGTLQTHTFVLPGGSLIGTGVLSHAGTGEFAVTGGTGLYHGVQGSYVVDQDVDSFNGGAATYTFSLILRKVDTDGR